MRDRPDITAVKPIARGQFRPSVRTTFGPRIVPVSKISTAKEIQRPAALFHDVVKLPATPAVSLATNAVNVIAPQPFARPAHPKQQQSVVLKRQAVRDPKKSHIPDQATYLAAAPSPHLEDSQPAQPARQQRKLPVAAIITTLIIVVVLSVSVMML